MTDIIAVQSSSSCSYRRRFLTQSIVALGLLAIGGCEPSQARESVVAASEDAGATASPSEAQPAACALQLIRLSGSDQIEVALSNDSGRPITFHVRHSALQMTDGAGTDVAPIRPTGERVVIAGPGATAVVSFDLSDWPLRAGATYVASIVTDGIRVANRSGPSELSLDCGGLVVSVEQYDGVGRVGTSLRTDEGCSAAWAAVLVRAYPVVLSAIRVARNFVRPGNPTFRRWFGDGYPGGIDNNVYCASGYLDQVLESYQDMEVQCQNICCTTVWGENFNGCFWNAGDGPLISVCDNLMDGSTPFLDFRADSTVVGTIVHELTHAAGTGDVTHSLCTPPGDWLCSTTAEALLLASAPYGWETDGQPCDYVGPWVRHALNSAENYEHFVQEAFQITVAAMSAL